MTYRTNFGRTLDELDDEPPKGVNGCCLAVLGSIAVWVAVIAAAVYLIVIR